MRASQADKNKNQMRAFCFATTGRGTHAEVFEDDLARDHGLGACRGRTCGPAGVGQPCDSRPLPWWQVPSTEQGTIPLLLSQTGAFSDTPAMIPNPGLVPYGLNAPLWSDDSRKLRWMGLPYDGTTNTPTVGNHPTGKWTFPDGTVIVKHFELVVNEQTNAVKRLRNASADSRDANGGVFGRSYRWRDDNSDADLVTEADGQRSGLITIIGPDGNVKRTQTWHYPGPPQCLQCHNNSNE